MWICHSKNNEKQRKKISKFHSSTDSQVCYIDIKLFNICECYSHGTLGDCSDVFQAAWETEKAKIERKIESQAKHSQAHVLVLCAMVVLLAETRQFRKIHLNLSTESDKIAYKTTLAFYVQNPKITTTTQ